MTQLETLTMLRNAARDAGYTLTTKCVNSDKHWEVQLLDCGEPVTGWLHLQDLKSMITMLKVTH